MNLSLYLTAASLGLLPSLYSQQPDFQYKEKSAHDRNVRHQNHPGTGRKSPEQRQGDTKQTAANSGLPSSDRAEPTAKRADQVTPPTTNLPARPPLTEALNFWVMGDALLWQAHEENLTYAYKSDATASFSTLKGLDFDWDWGFRVALGYNAPRDGWDLSLLWTHIENHAEDHLHADADSSNLILPVWNINDVGIGGPITQARAHWNVNLEQVDFALGKEYYVGKYLTLRPNGGLRADWIYQTYDMTYNFLVVPGFPQRFNMTNRFFGLGFFAGVDSDWMLGRGFSIYGMADFATLLGFFDVDQKVRQASPLTGFDQKGSIDSSLRCGRGVLDLTLGFKWSHLCRNNSWGITLKAGYEYHVYFDQNQFSLMANATKYFKPDGDLTYQGLALSGQIDF